MRRWDVCQTHWPLRIKSTWGDSWRTPVAVATASDKSRASCTTIRQLLTVPANVCPKNLSTSWWARLLTGQVALCLNIRTSCFSDAAIASFRAAAVLSDTSKNIPPVMKYGFISPLIRQILLTPVPIPKRLLPWRRPKKACRVYPPGKRVCQAAQRAAEKYLWPVLRC